MNQFVKKTGMVTAVAVMLVSGFGAVDASAATQRFSQKDLTRQFVSKKAHVSFYMHSVKKGKKVAITWAFADYSTGKKGSYPGVIYGTPKKVKLSKANVLNVTYVPQIPTIKTDPKTKKQTVVYVKGSTAHFTITKTSSTHFSVKLTDGGNVTKKLLGKGQKKAGIRLPSTKGTTYSFTAQKSSPAKSLAATTTKAYYKSYYKAYAKQLETQTGGKVKMTDKQIDQYANQAIKNFASRYNFK